MAASGRRRSNRSSRYRSRSRCNARGLRRSRRRWPATTLKYLGHVAGPPLEGWSPGLCSVGMNIKLRTRPTGKQSAANCRMTWFNGREDDRPLVTAPMTTRLSSSTTSRCPNRLSERSTQRTCANSALASSTLMCWGDSTRTHKVTLNRQAQDPGRAVCQGELPYAPVKAHQ